MTQIVSFETLERPSTPNTYLVLPSTLSSTAEADEKSPVFGEPAAALFKRVQMLVADQDNWEVVKTDEENMQLAVVAKTKLLKFKDDIAIRAFASDDGSQTSELAVLSRSRVGKYDFKANQKRVQSLLSQLKRNTAATA
ncbi:DUF1499 domain-containing protein [Henriciella marina]|uniref:DUF1499 domain-containing protein n=1 Tax=Henriciella marina TaxID=453851 RepID=UPI00036B3F3B|nr:DUF1499 domain-containing protein [Henriciella marina]